MSRKAFIEKLTEITEKDPRVILIVGDVGFSFLELYKAKFPKQFLNIGICEQTMMNVAVGLANVGWKPYVYTMSNFILLRPLEQVRNNICYGKSNVKLFGVKGSAAYAFLGFSHNLYDGEDQKILSTLPNLNSYFPDTEGLTKEFMDIEYQRNGPSYTQI